MRLPSGTLTSSATANMSPQWKPRNFGVLSKNVGKTAGSREGETSVGNSHEFRYSQHVTARENQKILESLAKTWGKRPVPRQMRLRLGTLTSSAAANVSPQWKPQNFGVLSRNVGKMAGSPTDETSVGNSHEFRYSQHVTARENQKILESLAKTWGKRPVPGQVRIARWVITTKYTASAAFGRNQKN